MLIINNIDTRYNHALSWVDISKGIVICLMVIGHSSLPQFFSRWIWSFHMPFFFFISALFSNWDKYTWSYFALRKGKILLIPFIVYSAINIFFFPYSKGLSHLDYFYQIITNGWGGVALWFVPIFYLSLIICKSIHEKYLVLMGLILVILGTLLSYNNIKLPWTLSSLPFAASIMIITRRFQNKIKLQLSYINDKLLILITLFGLFISLVISHYWRLDMASNNITPIIPISLGIIGGISCIIGISIIIDKVSLFRFFKIIGKNTYEIMALSQVIMATLKICISDSAILRYGLMIFILIIMTYIRKAIEGRLSRVEAI